MRSFNLQLSRLYSLTKAGFALFGLAALCGFVFLPSERHLHQEQPARVRGRGGRPRSAAVAGGSRPARCDRARCRSASSARWRSSSPGAAASPTRAATSFVAIAYRAGKQHRVDPLLILAVMAIESRYNPVAESVDGRQGPDAGHPEVPPGEAARPRRRGGAARPRGQHPRRRPDPARVLPALRRPARPRCRCTPAPSTSRPRSTPPRCSRRRRASSRSGSAQGTRKQQTAQSV